MRFTNAQVALFKAGISFAHMSPDRERMERAMADFVQGLSGTYYILGMNNHVYRDHGYEVYGYFGYSTPTPASIIGHPQVIFMDGKRDEWSIPRLYDECKHIPSEIDRCGPMVVR